MDKKINLKKQILSLKFFYEDLILENKALSSNVIFLEKLFRFTKQYTKNQKIINSNFDYNFQKDKNFDILLNRKKNLVKNVDKWSKDLKKSLLFNKYEELQREKEYLIEILKEKNSVLRSIQDELNAYKVNNPYNNFKEYKNLKSKFFLNETIELPSINNKINNKSIETNISLINSKFRKTINKEKINIVKSLLNSIEKLKILLNSSLYNYIKKTKALGFNSTLKSKKNNKTYIISVEPNKINSPNSSDSDSDTDNSFTKKKDSINERIFVDLKNYNINSSGKKIKKRKNINIKGYLLNNTFNNINVNTTSNFEINNESYKNLYENKRYIETEINEEKTNELNKKFLKIKENYYKCLDNRYQLKSALKSDISKIYKIKAKIKKIKKQQNIEKNS